VSFFSRFDNVVIGSHIACVARERSLPRVKMRRDGSRIDWISVDGLRIGEVSSVHCQPPPPPLLTRVSFQLKKLLPPGCSLDQVAATLNLPVSKMRMPWAAVTGHDFLARPRLPTSLDDWRNELQTQQTVTEEYVAAAHADFDSMGCRNCGDYLER
jgi:hypothetical protein